MTTENKQTAAKAETKIETVTMLDGRAVDFAGKRKLIKESFVEGAGADAKVKIRMDFRNGETRHFTIPDAMLHKFAAHGAEQKLGDEIAGLDDLDDAVLAIDDLMDRLNAGNWNMKREGGSMSGTSILAKALQEYYPNKSASDIKAFLSKKTQAEKVALRGNPAIKPIVDRLEAEKAAKGTQKVDTNKLLDELDGGIGAEPEGQLAEQPVETTGDDAAAQA